MGAIAPVLGTILQVGTALGTVANVVQPFAQDNTERKQQKQAQNLNLQQMQQDAAFRKEEARIATEQADSQRRSALKRAVARQRASFGSQGVGSNAGSSEAVLLGLFQESDEERVNREKLDSLRNNVIDQNLGHQQQLNLLQQTQLREKQYVDYLSRI
jgi:hypothetical protein